MGTSRAALRLIDKMLEFRCVPNGVVYTVLLDGMCRLGNGDGALRLIEEMEGNGLGANCAPNVVYMFGEMPLWEWEGGGGPW
jgi:pentatricopeptide repeat protein